MRDARADDKLLSELLRQASLQLAEIRVRLDQIENVVADEQGWRAGRRSLLTCHAAVLLGRLRMRCSRYALPVEAFIAIWLDQNEQCDGCHQPLRLGEVCIDHIHDEQREARSNCLVRSLLCHRCNLRLTE
jgi:hypothetical protein